MAVIQYKSKSNLLLSKQFADCIKKNESIFTPQFICISHSATKDWLVEQLVEYNGISANLTFQTPMGCIEMIHQILELDTNKKDLFRPNQINWLINDILNHENFKSQFPEIATYFQDDALKRFTLAEKIGGLFVKYQEFDSELVQELENSIQFSNYHKSWQSFVWKALIEVTQGNFSSFPKMVEEILEALKKDVKQQLLQSKVPTICFYGSISYTTDLLKLLNALGQFVTIEIFRLDNFSETNSSRFYENLSAFQVKQTNVFDQVECNLLEENENLVANTLLETIQYNLKGNIINLDYKEWDDSIQIVNNYSVYREVEALWNYLVTQFAKNDKLNQRDVSVIVPAMEKYAPAIKAIFGNGQPKFNFTFFDAGYKFQDSPYLALLALYEMESNTFTSKAVFSLLEYKYIREKFGFSENLDVVKRAIQLANIRHGFEGDETLETEFVSWKYGLKRLIYGACIEKTSDLLSFDDAEFYPVSEFETSDLYEIIRLNYFVEGLYEWATEKQKSRTLFAWVKHVEKTIEYFLEIQEFDPIQFNRQLEALMKVRELVAETTIPFQVMQYHLKQLFANMESSEKIGFGGIRFITTNPFMSFSSKIYCFLGMNGSDFPRKNRKLSFDLLSDKKEYTPSELDKNLFLNLILGAKEKLYVSYIGQSVKDNSAIPPSILVDELLDACHNLNISTKKIMQNHPLHSFSNLYNSQESNLVRYDKVNGFKLGQSPISNFVVSEFDRDEDGRKIIPLHDLIRFLEDPIRHYYNRVLGIYYSDNEVDLQECEPFELGVLESWGIKDEMLQSHLINEDMENPTLEKKRKGRLPFKNFGDRIIAKNEEEVAPLLDEISALIENKLTTTADVNFSFGNYRIKGKIGGLYDNTYLFATVSSDKWKYRIRSAIHFMLLTLNDETIKNGYYVSKDRKYSLNRCGFFESDLITLCEMYEKGSSELIHFTSDFNDLSSAKMDEFESIEQVDNYFSDKLNNSYSGVFPSDYFMKERDQGFLENKNKFEDFKTNYCTLIGIVESLISN